LTAVGAFGPRAACTTPTPFGSGDWVADFDGTILSADWVKISGGGRS
jgi:hypothetical protein